MVEFKEGDYIEYETVYDVGRRKAYVMKIIGNNVFAAYFSDSTFDWRQFDKRDLYNIRIVPYEERVLDEL